MKTSTLDPNADLKPIIASLFEALHGEKARKVDHNASASGEVRAYVRGVQRSFADTRRTTTESRGDMTVRGAYLCLIQAMLESIEKKVAILASVPTT